MHGTRRGRETETQNNLASHCEEGERQTRMAHMDKSTPRQQTTASSGEKMRGRDLT